MDNSNFQFDRVIIVDDTKIDRYIAKHVMMKNSFANDVIEFDMATKAIQFLEDMQDKPEKLPQIIVLDIRMPEMDGFQFLERLALLPQTVKQSCCIIMLTSSLDSSDHERAEKNPVVKKFLNKPLKKENLDEIRQLYLDSPMGNGMTGS